MNDLTTEPLAPLIDSTDDEKLLDGQLRRLIGCFDAFSERMMVRRSPDFMPDLEISRQEIRAVVMLGAKESTIMSDLAAELRVPLSTATHTMDKLVAKGLAERGRAEDNRRIVRVSLTPRGAEVYQSFFSCKLDMARNMLEALSPGEREIFLELMAKITAPAETRETH